MNGAHTFEDILPFRINHLACGLRFAPSVCMRTLALLLALVATPFVVHAQEEDAPAGARVAAARLSGFDVDRLSPGLQRDIDELIGRPHDLEEVAELAKRIEGERPGVTTSFRALRDRDGDARAIFFVARIEADRQSQSNINSRYTIERVVSPTRSTSTSSARSIDVASRMRMGFSAPKRARSSPSTKSIGRQDSSMSCGASSTIVVRRATEPGISCCSARRRST